MYGRRFLTFTAAILITVGQTLIFATDTAASAGTVRIGRELCDDLQHLEPLVKSLRLTEVLLPLLAARGWAPWPIEPGVRIGQPRARDFEVPRRRAREHGRKAGRVPFDDVQ